MVLILQLVFELLIFRSRISQGNGGGSVVRNAVGFDGGSASSYRRLAESPLICGCCECDMPLLFQQLQNGFRCCVHLGYRAETGTHVL